jgi:surface polysaccharide O-acyltransferase-like enzyme
MQENQIRREAGPDLYRILGLLFVVLLHAQMYNGFYDTPQSANGIWLANFIRWLTFSCNAMFMLLTGYLKIATTWNKRYYKSLLTVIIGYLLSCLIAYPIYHFFLGEATKPLNWILRCINFVDYGWYVGMYLGLFLISPIINLALDHIQDAKQQWFLVACLIFISSGHSITSLPVFPSFFSDLYPIAIYTLGAVIRRTQPKLPTEFCLAGVVLVSAFLAFTTRATADENFSSGFTQGFGGIWVILIATLLFLSIYRIRAGEKTGKFLSWLSGGVFEGYLLSRVPDLFLYQMVPQWHSPEHYPKIYLCISLPIFIISILAGKPVNMLARKLTNRLWRQAEKRNEMRLQRRAAPTPSDTNKE